MWLTKLKIAIVEQNINNINNLLNDIPNIKDLEDIETAIYLLKEASSLIHSLKDETKNSMVKIKQNLKFLKSTQENSKPTFDISL